MSTPTPDLADLEATFQEDLFTPLTLNDRCDADSAEAAVAQVLMGETVLKFCGHHFRVNVAELSKFPHSVPDADAKPMTNRRAAELGSVSRSTGDDHA